MWKEILVRTILTIMKDVFFSAPVAILAGSFYWIVIGADPMRFNEVLVNAGVGFGFCLVVLLGSSLLKFVVFVFSVRKMARERNLKFRDVFEGVFIYGLDMQLGEGWKRGDFVRELEKLRTH